MIPMSRRQLLICGLEYLTLTLLAAGGWLQGNQERGLLALLGLLLLAFTLWNFYDYFRYEGYIARWSWEWPTRRQCLSNAFWSALNTLFWTGIGVYWMIRAGAYPDFRLVYVLLLLFVLAAHGTRAVIALWNWRNYDRLEPMK